ncbi:ribosome hibernation-promoting factor, HPF/YfiA family [uncultured Clostridium sp.]|uniref:ribosome hibernation-promoting factor, HPF/YfiA family n=1 Tax=uncultured Clostridium sp. TaxID=59620 RepID=UPI0028E58920|nr:ribosome-associated translation inhibitor RaiA [uncultured Clostridium sp.]
MKVIVIAKNIELTNALREMVEKKISKLGKYFNSDIEAKATLSVQRNRQIVEIMIPFNGVVLRGEEANEDMYRAIDLVEEKLERQIRKQKTKLSRKKNGSLKFGEIVGLSPVAADEEEAKLVKRKRFGVKPMDIDEAILQMELVGHSFFVYQDVESNKINVIYKRKDGDYGLLDPEYR